MSLKTAPGPDHEEQALDPQALTDALHAARLDLQHARRLVAEGTHPDAPGILGRELVRTAQALSLGHGLDEAAALLREAMDLWGRLGRDRARFLAQLKLAIVHRRQADLALADDLLTQLVTLSEQPPFDLYRDFALHERGLTRLKAHRHHDARQDLQQALALRHARGAPRLLRATQALLDAIKE